ncbi:unnamed protein product [Angiostrongylus costaricensis]|uniref:THO complex subunit 2 n=1 Tax=Angiostrongylus costaricensis TaxID=334426 RepID=A0A158PDV5_ANGCS|nr:unnamed protein product [Angiostrongylus costaricensis]
MDKLSTWQQDTVEAFLVMFENFFQTLSDETRCSVMRLVYEKNLPKDGDMVFLGNYLKSFSSEVAGCVNGIGDHNEIQNNPQKFSYIRKKLSWYLFTIPGPTLRRLLSQCLQNKLIVPGVALSDLTVKSEKVPLENIPILIDSIIFLFEEEASRLEGTGRQEDFVYLVTSLCRRKRDAVKEKPGLNAVQTPEFLLLIVQLFMEYESKHRQAAEICHSILKALSGKLKCLYKSLSLNRQEQYEQISVDFPFSPADCFFRSLFELALFEIDVALDFLKKGIAVFPRDENLIEKIAIALIDSCEQMSYKRNITSLAPLLSELLWESDNGRNLRSYPTCESDSGTNHVPDTLLQAFCELTKVHAEKEVVNLRHNRLFQPPDIKEDQLPPPYASIRLDERVYAQIAVLFNVACSLTRLVPETPTSLKSNTVYAFAKADVKKQGNYKTEENQEKSEKHSVRGATFSTNELCSVQNELFDRLGTTKMQGLTLEVLEKLAKTYEEMQKTNEELKNSLKIIKEALTKPSTMTETKSGWASDTTLRTPPKDQLVAQPNGTAQATKSVPTTTAETTTTPETQTDLKQPGT